MKTSLTRALRHGGYSLIVTAVLLTVLILVNLGMNLLPAGSTTFAGEAMNIYDISDISRDFMSELEQDVTVYVVVSDESSNSTLLWIKEYVARYADLSSHIHVETVDPVLYPNFLASYTDEVLSSSEAHLVIVGEETGRSRVVPYSDLFYTLYTSAELEYIYMLYGYYPDNPTYFNVESSLLSGIDYVTMEKLPTLYYTTGHGEVSLDETMTYLLAQENITFTELALATTAAVPDDADALLICVPSKDFTEAEIDALRAYADRGGKLILFTYYNSSDTAIATENLFAFAEEYGLLYESALVHEGNTNYYYSDSSYSYPHCIFPQIPDDRYADSVAENTYLFLASSHPIGISEELPAGVSVTELLTTTTAGYLKTEIDENYTGEKEEGDVSGRFVLGALAEKTVGQTTSSFYWFSSYELLNGGWVGYFSNANYVMSVFNDACQKEASITVGATELEVTALTVSENAADLWGVLLIGVLPAAILLYGFVLWYRRSRS